MAWIKIYAPNNNPNQHPDEINVEIVVDDSTLESSESQGLSVVAKKPTSEQARKKQPLLLEFRKTILAAYYYHSLFLVSQLAPRTAQRHSIYIVLNLIAFLASSTSLSAPSLSLQSIRQL